MRVSELSLKRLREAGYTVGLVERFIAPMQIKQDLFGFIDYVAIMPGKSVLGVQCTNGHLKDHIEKILAEPRVKTWLQTGSRIVIHCWNQRSKRGVKTWELDLTRIELDLKGNVLAVPF